VIATLVEGNEEAVRLAEAQDMVATNTGFLLMGLGFVMQIFAVQVLQPAELLNQNLLSSTVPSVISTVLLVVCLWLAFQSLGYFRKTRLDNRELDI
jgi:hypothetical protein